MPFQVRSFTTFSLADYVFMHTETLRSLQIVQSELHPNSQVKGRHSNGGDTKESLSIYGLLHHLSSTSQGRVRLRQILLRPTTNVDVITERQLAISVLNQPVNAGSVRQVASILRKIPNMRTTVRQLQKGADCSSDGRSVGRGVWATLRRFAVHALRLREAIEMLAGCERVDILRKVPITPPLSA